MKSQLSEVLEQEELHSNSLQTKCNIYRTALISLKKVGVQVQVDAEKSKLLSRHQNAGQIHNIKTANRFFENVVQFICFGTSVINQNLNQEEVKKRLISGNDCYHSVQKRPSARILSKTIILRVVLYGCYEWVDLGQVRDRWRALVNTVMNLRVP
ncbi:hypothetical protein B7P43_G06462 [Cryptotermes secundus]|uniref:Reverse transcriptase domain-containing protein n=1 Tax=Cryptotermes secundus TaxID=105785 RepID=A0A2J7QJN0_9NEOP|nr:hypothetical protein B7P43_G06462 [Cryptotermes secundus]